MPGKNVFIDFEIIRASNLENLIQELDVLIAARKHIFVWHKSVPTQIMKKACENIIVPVTKKEYDLHKKIKKMHALGKPYKEISAETEKSVKELAYYIKFNPDEKLTLDDWIVDYYKKDSSIYPKVDIVIDNDPKIVDRFKRAGIEANWVEKV